MIQNPNFSKDLRLKRKRKSKMKSSTPAKRRRLDKKVSSNLLDSTEIRKRYLEEHMLKKKTWHLSDFSKKLNTLRIGSKIVLYRLSYRLPTKFDIAFFLIFRSAGPVNGRTNQEFPNSRGKKVYLTRIHKARSKFNLIISHSICFP